MLKRCFHSSTVQFARKSGANAFDAKPRGLSKKQKKRKAGRMVARAEVIDQRKEKIKERHMKNQTPEVMKFMHESQEQLKGAFQDLFLPDSTPRLDVGEVEETYKPKVFVNPKIVLYSLRDNKAKQDLLLSGSQNDGSISHEDSQSQAQSYVKTTAAVNESEDTAQERSNPSIDMIRDRDIRMAEKPSAYQISEALAAFTNKANYKDMSEMVNLMIELEITTDPKTWLMIMSNCTRNKRFKLAEDYFDLMIKSGCDPDQYTWSALVFAKVRGRGADVGLEQIEILKRTGVTPTIHMFTSVLKELIDTKRYDEANSLWIRMHCEECDLTTKAFNTILVRKSLACSSCL
jgi:pentatricopeptide repeat protein